MSCETSPQTASSPQIKFHTAAFASSSPSCRKRKRESEGDEVCPNSLRSLPRFLARNEDIYKYMPESISGKPKDERVMISDPLPPITCSPQSMKKIMKLQAKKCLDNCQSSESFSQMMAVDSSPLNLKDFSIGNLMGSPASLVSVCDKSDDDLSAEGSRNPDSPHHLILSFSRSPPTSHMHPSDPKPEVLQVPRSPSDRCQNKNLRRTALLKSLKMHDHNNSNCATIPFGRDEESEGYVVVRTSQDNSSTTAAVARSRLCIETLDGFLSQKCHL